MGQFGLPSKPTLLGVLRSRNLELWARNCAQNVILALIVCPYLGKMQYFSSRLVLFVDMHKLHINKLNKNHIEAMLGDLLPHEMLTPESSIYIVTCSIFKSFHY